MYFIFNHAFSIKKNIRSYYILLTIYENSENGNIIRIWYIVPKKKYYTQNISVLMYPINDNNIQEKVSNS